MKKITIIGDVMVEPPFLQQAKKEDGYDFYTPIKALAPIFEASDYVIGNLERTLRVLDKAGIAHTGTYPRGYTGSRNYYFEIGDTKFALIAYAHSTNYGISTVVPEG